MSAAPHTASTPPPLPTLLDEDGGDESPLNAYLADAERSFDSDALGSPFKSHETVRSSRRQTARTTSPSPITARIASAACIVPHPIDISSASSLATAATTDGHVPRTPQQHDTTNAVPARMAGTGGGRGSLSSAPLPFQGSSDAFVERFQYLVASSGLLEKTQLDLSKSPRKDTFEKGGPPQAHTAATAALDVPRALDAVNEALAANTRIRLDIVGAITALVVALAYVLGPLIVLVSAAGIAAAVFYLKPDILPRTPSATPPPTSSPQAPAHEEEVGALDDATEQSTAVLKSLEEFIAESRDLDQSVASSLQLLRPDDTEQAHELRIALHRVMEDMTDSLAAATSTFVPMADRTALTVLEDMYDVSVAKSRRQRRSPSTDDDDDDDNDNESTVPVRRRLRPRASSHSAAGAVPDLLTGGLLTPRERAHAKSPIRGLQPSSFFDANDKFTSLPVRTPRHRRGSWSHDWNTAGSPLQQRQERREREAAAEEDAGNESVMSASSTESSLPASLPETLAHSSVSPPARRRVSTFMPKRGSPLAQALEQLEGTKPRGPPPSSFNAPFPVMQSRGNVRRSLQDIPYIHSAPMSSADNAANLALARASATMSSANRRSLQVVNSPQARETMDQAIAAGGVSLQRARSLPQSERGMRGTKSSPNSKRSSTIMGKGSPSVVLPDRPTWSSPASKRTSLTLTEAHHARQSDLGIGFLPLHIPRPSRVVSVSPLTLSGLKAAYFGVHSKRRRIACCLLGMRFNEERDGEYWTDVRTALQSLTEAMTSGKERLEALRIDAEREAVAQSTIINLNKSPATPRRFNLPAGGAANFAPRDSTEQALLSSIDELQRSLARVWARCDELRARVESGDTGDLVAEWTDMRGDVGGMLRHVERGRELARRDWQSEEETELLSDYPDDRPVSPLPEFLRAWAPSPGPGAAEITRSGDEHEPLLTVDEHLPPPGVDEVYEATLPPAVSVLRPKAAMSREERIALTREARARGLSLAQLTAASSSSPAEREAEARRQAEAERLRAGGEMVAELQGMFGAIRRRKGMDDDGEGVGVGVGVGAEEVGVAL